MFVRKSYTADDAREIGWSRNSQAAYQGRDLAPVTDLRAIMKGVLQDQFSLGERVLAETVFRTVPR